MQHLDLVVLDALLRYRALIVLVLVASGIIPQVFRNSDTAIALFYAFAFGVWPVIYLGAARLSRLYAQLPKSGRA